MKKLKKYGEKAVIVNNNNDIHNFPIGSEVIFVKLGKNFGQWEFEDIDNGIRQTIYDEHFEWID